MKYALVIGDGMADEAAGELGGRTPLAYAATPALDALASAGAIGTAVTIPEGMPPGSDTATLTILGCDPKSCYFARAPIEAAALGVKLAQGDTAYRCNMVTLAGAGDSFEDKTLASHCAGSIEGETADRLITELWNNKKFRQSAKNAGMEIYPGGSFRHIAVQKAPPGGADAPPAEPPAELTPPHDHLGERVGELLKYDGNSAVLTDLMQEANKFLENHPINEERRENGKLPANGIWFWAGGTAVRLPDFGQRYSRTGSVIAAVPNCRGIGMLMGLTLIDVPGATGDLNTNYEGKAEAAAGALKTHDFALIHIEAPDECTHSGDLPGKLQAIEHISSRVVAPLYNKLREAGEPFRMMIISDHKTLLRTRGHDGSPVPFILYDSRYDAKTGLSYCEENAEKLGKYKDIDATALMRLLFSDFER